MEPPVVPRFLAALEEGGAAARRVAAYVTRTGVTADDIAPEAALMSGGCVDAVVFTSTAEAQGLLAALGGAEDLQALVLEQGTPPPVPRSASTCAMLSCACESGTVAPPVRPAARMHSLLQRHEKKELAALATHAQHSVAALAALRLEAKSHLKPSHRALGTPD